MKNDALDTVLKGISSRDDWRSLCEICDCKSRINPNIMTRLEFIKAFNKEIRSNYGNSFANIFRDEYSPDYDDILKATAKKLSIKYIPDKLGMRDIEMLENGIIAKVLESIKAQIIKKEGYAAWEAIENNAMNEMSKLYAEGKISDEDYSLLKKYGLSAGMMASIVAGKMAGFALYMLVNQIFFAISRYLGLSIGVAIAGPIIGKTLAMLLGPVGWAIAALSVAYELGNTNWQKTIGSVVFIAIMRKKQIYGLD